MKIMKVKQIFQIMLSGKVNIEKNELQDQWDSQQEIATVEELIPDLTSGKADVSNQSVLISTELISKVVLTLISVLVIIAMALLCFVVYAILNGVEIPCFITTAFTAMITVFISSLTTFFSILSKAEIKTT